MRKKTYSRKMAWVLLLLLSCVFIGCADNNQTFTLKGKVEQGINVEKYLVYIFRDYDHPEQFPEPMDTIEVKNGLFSYSTTLDQPYSGLLKAVAPDGSEGEYFLEFMFVPGESCEIDVYGEGLNEFTLGGSKFYRDWEAFAQFYNKERKKAIELQGAGDDAFFAAIADYNSKHKDEEGCIMYQYMWRYARMDYSIADGISQGRFKNYIQYMRK